MAQSSAYVQQKELKDLSFWKDAWLQSHSKERSAPHTLSRTTRGTDMEKYKSWHVVGHCSPLEPTVTLCSIMVWLLQYN